jgi:hypothetical protein
MLSNERMLVSAPEQMRGMGDCRACANRGGNLGGFGQLRAAGSSITGCVRVKFDPVPTF